MVNYMPCIRGSQTPVREFYQARRAVQPLRRGAQNPQRMACHSFGACIFDGEAVKSAFALLLTKVTKPSQRNWLSRAVSGTRYG